MSYAGPIQDHNDRVAHSTSWDDPPEPETPHGITRKDVYIPEPAYVKITCFYGDDITEKVCIVCNRTVKELVVEELIDSFGCYSVMHPKVDRYGATYYDEEVKGHICMDCWDDLPEGEEK